MLHPQNQLANAIAVDDMINLDTTYDSRAKRIAVATWAVIETMLFGGIVNGWGSLVFVLKDEGLYSSLCDVLPAMANVNASSLFHITHNTTSESYNNFVVIISNQ